MKKKSIRQKSIVNKKKTTATKTVKAKKITILSKKNTAEEVRGFQVSASKTINIPLETLFEVWTNDKIRGEWLTETIYIRKEVLHKCLRFDWFNGTPIEVNFYDKGKNKSQVVVQHSKLANAEEAEKMQIFWQEALERLLKLLKATYGVK